MLFGIHNHILECKFVNHPIAISLDCDEKKIVVEMTLNMFLSENIFANLKRKRHDNVPSIKQVYNV